MLPSTFSFLSGGAPEGSQSDRYHILVALLQIFHIMANTFNFFLHSGVY